MNIGVPQLIVISLMFLNLGITLVKHGEPRDEKYNFSLELIGFTILTFILWWGGFFT